jgi:hypothetical protein
VCELPENRRPKRIDVADAAGIDAALRPLREGISDGALRTPAELRDVFTAVEPEFAAAREAAD